MKRLLTLCLLLAACNTRTTDQLQAEYDSVIKEQQKVNELLKVGGQWAAEGEGMGMDLKNEATEVNFQQFLDSLTIRKEALENRRKELAQMLYK